MVWLYLALAGIARCAAYNTFGILARTLQAWYFEHAPENVLVRLWTDKCALSI